MNNFKYNNITKDKFKLTHVINTNRLHFIIEYQLPNNKILHIA